MNASSLISEMKRKFEESSNVDLDDKKKKKKSRWGTADDLQKTFIPGMPTTLPANLTPEQEEQYLIHLQIEEMSRRLRSGDLGIPINPEERSPSPEPIYNNEGKRLNTRDFRTRKKLEEDRHALIIKAYKLNNEYKPPQDYKPPLTRITDKVWIPQDAHPEINFVGLLIGPRGNTLKYLEKETGAKIIIRGKGSVKDGKIGRKDGQPLPGEDEPLHAYITANNPEVVKKAAIKINEIIKQGIEVPDADNELRKQQLRELALLNGTLRDNDGLAKLKQLAQAQTIVTNTIICTVCGGAGHIAQDCKQKRPGESILQTINQTPADRAKMDSEYMSLMAELGQGPPPPMTKSITPATGPLLPLPSPMTRLPPTLIHGSTLLNQPPQSVMCPPVPNMSVPPPQTQSTLVRPVPPPTFRPTITSPNTTQVPVPQASLSQMTGGPGIQPWQQQQQQNVVQQNVSSVSYGKQSSAYNIPVPQAVTVNSNSQQMMSVNQPFTTQQPWHMNNMAQPPSQLMQQPQLPQHSMNTNIPPWQLNSQIQQSSGNQMNTPTLPMWAQITQQLANSLSPQTQTSGASSLNLPQFMAQAPPPPPS